MTPKTTIDWLTFRCRNDRHSVLDALLPVFGRCADLLSISSALEPKDGWKFADEILLGGDISLGRIDWGGESQRGWVRVILTGEGCAWVQDWKAAAGLEHVLIGAEIRRVDIALTTYAGEVSHKKVVKAFEDGEFTNGGRPPVMRTIVSSDERAGKTCYIGKRENAKFLRCYEKGFELIKDYREGKDRVTHIGADRIEDIYRVEVELKAVEKFIPFFTLLQRDDVFAGAYPFCAKLLGMVEGIKLQTLPDFKPVATLDKALENCRISYGNILRTALEALDGDKLAVMERIIGITRSDTLVRAGILTVVHPV